MSLQDMLAAHPEVVSEIEKLALKYGKELLDYAIEAWRQHELDKAKHEAKQHIHADALAAEAKLGNGDGHQ